VHAKQLLASLAACVAARVAAARHGGAGRGLARGGERRARRWRAHGAETSGAGQLGLEKAASEGGGRAQREIERGRGWR
jgi:hypothetical protein